MDNPQKTVETGARRGIKMLSPNEARWALPHFGVDSERVGTGDELGAAHAEAEG